MIIAMFVLAFLLYLLYFVASLSDIRHSTWFFPIGIICAVVCNTLWMLVVRMLGDPSKIAVGGVVWDVLVMVSVVIAPLMLGVSLSMQQWVGVVIACTGVGVMLSG